MKNDFVCKKCGKCCFKYFKSIKATPDDIERWKRQGRTDILKYVLDEPIDVESYLDNSMIEMFLDEDICPFLKEVKSGIFHCMIHDTKPSFCSNYPENNICEGMKER